ncbi:MAG: hypothetical protein H0U75_12600 [Legionella sp.]|nr:hypothetical protein [Legionella sp.]
MVYEVICIEDLDSKAQEDWAKALRAGRVWEKNRQLIPEGAHIESQGTLLDAMQERLEQADLDRIDAQKPLRDLKQLMQNTMVSWLQTCDPSLQKKQVDNWAGFFNKVSKEQDVDKAQAQWDSWRTLNAIPEIMVKH